MPNSYQSPPPQELLELFEDPRLDGMEEAYGASDTGGRQLPAPVARPTEPSRFLELSRCFGEGPNLRAKWVNEPGGTVFSLGHGTGVGQLTETPRIEQYCKRPRRLPQLWFFGELLVASPQAVELFARRDPQGIETRPIEWVFNDGKKLDGYAFMDIVHLEYGYDYRRSELNISFKRGKGRWLRALGTPRPIRSDLPPDLHFYRDAYYLRRALVSRELAFEIDGLIKEEIRFDDPHGAILYGKLSERFKRDAPPSKEGNAELESIDAVDEASSVNSLLDADVDGEQDIHRRIGKQVMPLLDAGRFADADELLTGWLAALPAPFGPAARCPITNSPQDVGAFLDRFIAMAAKEREVAALYIEMNAFGVNTKAWFFDVFAFSFYGGLESYDWLEADFASTEESLRITGMEPLQLAYEKLDRRSAEATYATAVADALVITRLHRLLADAIQYCHALKVPLLATAHDYDEYVVEIPCVNRP